MYNIYPNFDIPSPSHFQSLIKAAERRRLRTLTLIIINIIIIIKKKKYIEREKFFFNQVDTNIKVISRISFDCNS